MVARRRAVSPNPLVEPYRSALAPRDVYQLETLECEAHAAIAQADRARTEGRDRDAADWDARAEEILEALEGRLAAIEEDLVEQEAEPQQWYVPPEPADHFAAMYHAFVTQSPTYYFPTQAELASNLRSFLREVYGPTEIVATDEQLVAAAREAYEAKLAMRARLGGARDANPAIPVSPAVAQSILEAASDELEGFGGECGNVAVAINDVLFGGQGKIVAVLNEYLFQRGDWVGHVVVVFEGRYWDLEGQKRLDDVEEYAMLDWEDPDYGLPDEQAGYGVGMWEVTGAELRKHLPGSCPLKNIKKVLRRLRRDYEANPDPASLGTGDLALVRNSSREYIYVSTPDRRASLSARPWHGPLHEHCAQALSRAGASVPYIVEQVDVARALRRKGLGVELYVAAVEEAAKYGGALIASACVVTYDRPTPEEPGYTSKAAHRVWRSRRFAQRVRVDGLVASLPGSAGNPADPASPAIRDLPLMVVDEAGWHFETGVPVQFDFIRNVAPSPYFGATYQQDLEPAGRYMLLRGPWSTQEVAGWESGRVRFEKPLVLALNADPRAPSLYNETSWKALLSGAYGGKTGKALSKALRADGYDGVVTVWTDERGRPLDTREIVDLTVISKNPAPRDKGGHIGVRKYVSPRSGQKLTRGQARVRRVAYALKTGEPWAVAAAVEAMAPSVPPWATLVPIPDSQGHTDANRALANALATRTGAAVADVLTRAQPVEASHARRRTGRRGLPSAEHQIVARGPLAAREVLFIDNVVTTGATFGAARAALGGLGRGLAYAAAPEVLATKNPKGRKANVIAPKGPGRPRPQHLFGNSWRYRGRLIEIYAQPGGGYKHMIAIPGKTGVFLQFTPSPDPHASLQFAVFRVDLLERTGETEPGFVAPTKTAEELLDAFMVVSEAINKLHRRGDPLDRAHLARMVEQISRTPTDVMHDPAQAFNRFTLPERIELLDEMIAVARSHGDRFPNPHGPRSAAAPPSDVPPRAAALVGDLLTW